MKSLRFDPCLLVDDLFERALWQEIVIADLALELFHLQACSVLCAGSSLFSFAVFGEQLKHHALVEVVALRVAALRSQ